MKAAYVIVLFTATISFARFPYSIISFIIPVGYVAFYKGLRRCFKTVAAALIPAVVSAALNSGFGYGDEAPVFRFGSISVYARPFIYALNYASAVFSTIIWCSLLKTPGLGSFGALNEIFPKTAFFTSVTFGYVPRIKQSLESSPQACKYWVNRRPEKGPTEKFAFFADVFKSALVSSLENSNEFAELLRRKGYSGENYDGAAYSPPRRITKSDFLLTACVFIIPIAARSLGDRPGGELLSYVFFAALPLLPLFVNLLEDLKS